MNIEEKTWDSFVLFAPEKMMEQDTEVLASGENRHFEPGRNHQS